MQGQICLLQWKTIGKAPAETRYRIVHANN